MAESKSVLVKTNEEGYFEAFVEVSGGPGIGSVKASATAGGGGSASCSVDAPSSSAPTPVPCGCLSCLPPGDYSIEARSTNGIAGQVQIYKIVAHAYFLDTPGDNSTVTGVAITIAVGESINYIVRNNVGSVEFRVQGVGEDWQTPATGAWGCLTNAVL